MQRYILKRIVIAILTLIVISFVIFFVMRLGEADPVLIMLPPDARPEDRDLLMETFGLDKPIPVQFLYFLKSAVRGDFGRSFKYDEPALTLLLSRVPATLELALAAIFLTSVIGLTIGIVSAVKRDSLFDRFGKMFALAGQAIPSFWLGIMLMLLLGVMLRLFPISGRGGLDHLVLPALTLSAFNIAAITRLSRSSMIDALKSDYVAMAHAKGVPGRAVILIHAFKNASIPILTMMGLLFGYLITGAVVTETIFSWPGVGRLALEAVFARDYPVVQAFALFASFVFVTANLVVDILYAYIDPRIRYQ
ncbi:MAG: ABC transporter permease [Deltaproteobacteria bacterium]|nr:ABC transporter permease [Deltaproteobacteria bacterium]MBW2085578.1 ABC transporter permease [Deltaproteobacteria bacterium]